MDEKTRRFPMAPSLRRLGKQLAKKLDIRPLRPGEARPNDFYTSNHFTGGSAKRSVVRIEKTNS